MEVEESQPIDKAATSQVDVDSGFENMEVEEAENRKDVSQRQRVSYAPYYSLYAALIRG